VGIFWGDTEPLPMPDEWELIAAADGHVSDDPHAGTHVTLYKSSASAGLNAAATLLRAHVKGVSTGGHEQAHVDGVSASIVSVRPPRVLKLLQLRCAACGARPRRARHAAGIVAVWCGVAWCGVVWRGVVWRGMAWYGVVLRGVT
jgi:hypothetical protein